MDQLFWKTIKSKKFNIGKINSKVNADKLFVCFLLQVEEKEIDENKLFYIEEITDLIPRGTAQIDKHATYGFSISKNVTSSYILRGRVRHLKSGRYVK